MIYNCSTPASFSSLQKLDAQLNDLRKIKTAKAVMEHLQHALEMRERFQKYRDQIMQLKCFQTINHHGLELHHFPHDDEEEEEEEEEEQHHPEEAVFWDPELQQFVMEVQVEEKTETPQFVQSVYGTTISLEQYQNLIRAHAVGTIVLSGF
ncbi:hypothetical protein HDU97_003216 [Phlyctochytrium planicorne]|nr:hypothetical protein HDU97_003216 [Phlyctochytrium planicorne]